MVYQIRRRETESIKNKGKKGETERQIDILSNPIRSDTMAYGSLFINISLALNLI
jgi:hypothetical protein